MSGLNSTPSHTALKLLRVKNQQSRDENSARSQRQSHDQREGLRGLSDRIPHAWGAGMVTRRVSLEPSSRPGELRNRGSHTTHGGFSLQGGAKRAG